jgi:Histidine kinase-, DNA gyrase B-, and HSP90-like ATPase
VSLQVVADQVSLEIGDDGVGFVPGQAADPPGLGHFGLAGMRQQVEMAGGVWQLRSRPGRGTTVTATLPMAGARPGGGTAAPARAVRAGYRRPRRRLNRNSTSSTMMMISSRVPSRISPPFGSSAGLPGREPG